MKITFKHLPIIGALPMFAFPFRGSVGPLVLIGMSSCFISSHLPQPPGSVVGPSDDQKGTSVGLFSFKVNFDMKVKTNMCITFWFPATDQRGMAGEVGVRSGRSWPD